MFYMNLNPDKKWGRGDTIALLLLFIAVLALFIPALTGWRGIFHDDQAMVEFPWHYFLARHFQNGIIPLWEPDTWCGAIPFYARYYADTYYFPLWPFYLATRLGDLTQAYWMLSLIPLLLHYWLAAAGMYIFGRRSLRLHTLPAFLTAWVYIFSPIFAYKYVAFPIIVVQAWLPWALTLVVSMDKRAALRKIIGLGVIFALMFFAAQPPHLGYSLLLAGVISLALALRRFAGKRGFAAFRGPLQLLAAVVLSLLLAAVFILPVLEGMEYTEQHLAFTYEGMTGGDGSMPPVYLTTLFVPDIFGTWTGFNNRNWVDSVAPGVRFWDTNMSGGLVLTFLVLAAIFLGLHRKNRDGLRFWIILGGGLEIFALLCMLGKHTPFYYLFYKIVPVLSDFPFPIRYVMIQAVVTAWLAGIALEILLYREGSSSYPRPRLIVGYLGIVLIAGLIALMGGTGLAAIFRGEFSLPGLNEIIRRGNLSWFITGPVLYFAAAGILLVLAWKIFQGRRRAHIIAGLVMLETAIFAFAAFYFCIFRFHNPQPQQLRSTGPENHPMIRRVLGPMTDLMEEDNLRWATDQPFHDDFARFELSGSYAFMGYDMKPLEKRFKQAFEAAYHRPVDWPIYWDYPRPETGAFLSNMSVGYLMDSRPENIFPGGRTVKMETAPDFYLHYNPAPLPRAFTLDRIVECSEEEAMEELVRGDLRKAVFVEDGKQLAVSSKQSEKDGKQLAVSSEQSGEESKQLAVSGKQSAASGAQLPLTAHRSPLTVPSPLTAHRLPLTSPSPLTAYRSFDPGSEEEYIARFNNLQSANPIKELDLTNPNRVEIDITVIRPAMLVLTEIWYPGWEAMVDKEPSELYRVNYLQRGVWMEEGEHLVELIFRPRSWLIGVIISLISWGIVIIVAICWGLKKVLPVSSQ